MFYKTGITQLDVILCGKGVKYPSIIEIFGSENTSKSTIAQHFFSCFLSQVKNSKCIYINTEFKSDEVRFDYILNNFNLDKDRVNLIEKNNINEIKDILLSELKSAKLDGINLVIVIDSVANMIDGSSSGGYSGAKDTIALTGMLTSISELLYKTNSHLIIINQVRDNMGGYGLRTPKGRALKHLAGIRCKLKQTKSFKKKIGGIEIEQGILVQLETVKNQYFLPNLSCYLFIDNEKGVDTNLSIIENAKSLNIISQSGAWSVLKLQDEELGLDFNFKWRSVDDFKELCSKEPKLLPALNYLILSRYSIISDLSKLKLEEDINYLKSLI